MKVEHDPLAGTGGGATYYEANIFYQIEVVTFHKTIEW